MSSEVKGIDLASAVPPYEQVRTQIAAAAAEGVLQPGHKLPTVRRLAADLGLAANTVARAYRELEADGIVTTQGRRGTFVRSAVVHGDVRTPQRADAEAAAATFTATARKLGLSLAETTRLVEAAWARAGAAAR